MQRLIMLVSAVALTLSPLRAPAQTLNPDCNAALTAADKVISKQGELILFLGEKNTKLQTEDDQLSKALVDMKQLSDRGLERDIMMGVGGAALGILLTSVLIHK